MKTIWYFVGLILIVYGLVITGTGLYLLVSPPASKTVLYDTHPNIWWGLVMLAAGIVYLVTNKNKRVE